MNKLILKLNGINAKGIDLKIDGERVKPQKNKFGNRFFEYETEKETAHIAIKKYLEINSRAWLIWQMLFFFFSLLGILDVRPDKRCSVVDCEFEVPLKEDTKITLTMNYTKNEEKALKVEADTDVKEIKNVAYVDQKAKKRLKIVRVLKIFTVIAIVFAVAMLVVILS